eukprot:CAMPEP_0119331986 /NCGR_PEP_ID=MMETSP1333-20130426/81794_1 /TAXON_ID=418940 /ORGANISM="Scyphosphaera apsteinii, Strain RCC1455" /LENGTH=127 /DNA_ID=CAMNT_0007341715 /DNA_START=47 /DNA_END=426 /DNA_ORIENTATION=-
MPLSPVHTMLKRETTARVLQRFDELDLRRFETPSDSQSFSKIKNLSLWRDSDPRMFDGVQSEDSLLEVNAGHFQRKSPLTRQLASLRVTTIATSTHGIPTGPRSGKRQSGLLSSDSSVPQRHRTGYL